MDFTTLALIFTTLYVFYLYVRRNQNYFKDLGIPHVTPWPLLGNTASAVLGFRHIKDIVNEAYNCDKDAKYVGFYNFVQPVLLVRDLELVKNVSIKDFDHFADRETTIAPGIDLIVDNSLSTMTGARWREARNLLTPAFTSSKMKAMFDLMIPYIEAFLTYVDQLPACQKKMLNTKDLFTRFGSDVIATCAFGIHIDSLNDPKNEFYVAGHTHQDFEGLVSPKVAMSRCFPRLFKLLGLRFVAEKTKNFFRDVVDQTVRTREAQGITRPDVIQMMMDARGKTSADLKLDEIDMAAIAFGFFFGGFDTASSQMCLMAHVLAIHPEVQKRLQSEIDEVLANVQPGQKVTYDTINSMAYLDAVFNETTRCHPVALTLNRACTKEYTLPPAKPGLKPYRVKVGDSIWIPVMGIHMDKQYYEDPDRFNPDRFLNKKVGINQTTSLGFGIGPRSCIVAKFATVKAKTLIFFILSRYNIKKTSRTCDPFEYESSGFEMKPKGGFWVALEKREA